MAKLRNHPADLPPRPTTTATQTEDRVDIGRRISIGLVSLSLSLISLALGAAFLSVAGPAAFLVAPSATLESVPTSATAVTLLWTAPGDDGTAGQAAAYDLRYSLSPIDSGSFTVATPVSGEPAPQPAGSTESFTVSNLSPATTYFFALVTNDEAGNVSGLSNIASATTDALPSACVPVYQCSDWSACVSSVQTRTCTVTNGCASNLDQPVTSQVCTRPPTPAPDPTPEPAPEPSPEPPPSGGGETVRLLKHIIASGVGPGTIPVVRTINPTTKKAISEFVAFRRDNKNGTNVGVGDINGDHLAEVLVGSGAGSDPLVKIFSERGTLIAQFNPYPTSRGIGVDVTAGDVDGDGRDEIITVPAKSAAHLRIFRYDSAARQVSALAQMFAFPRDSRQGFTVAAGDLDLDGRAEMVVAPRANGRSVAVYRYDSNRTIKKVSQFPAANRIVRTGLSVTIGDSDANGRNEIIAVPGPGYASLVRVFDLNGRQLRSFRPASTAWLGGVDLTSLDVNTDGRDEIITGSYRDGDPAIRVFRYNGATKKFEMLQNYFIFPKTMKAGLRLDSQ